MLIPSTVVAMPHEADATDGTATSVTIEPVPEINTDSDGGFFILTISRKDGSVSTARVDQMNYSTALGTTDFTVTNAMKGPMAFTANNRALIDISGIEPGVKIGFPSADSNSNVNINDSGFHATTKCLIPNEGGYDAYCLTAALTAAPTAQSTSVAQVPVTGAPSSDLIMPAVLVASGMVVMGFMVSRRRRRD